MIARSNPIAFRAGELEAPLSERSSGVLSPALVAQRDLGRYYEMLRRALPAFSAPEASLIVDACNGWLVEPHAAPLLWAEVDDAIRGDGLAEKWGVDRPALVARLRARRRSRRWPCAMPSSASGGIQRCRPTRTCGAWG